MLTIAKLNDLEQFGFNLLTGEACALSLRILTDMNEQGKNIFCKAFGFPVETKLPPAWNRETGGRPSVASVKLHPDVWLILGVFALMEANCHTVLQCDVQTSSVNPYSKRRCSIAYHGLQEGEFYTPAKYCYTDEYDPDSSDDNAELVVTVPATIRTSTMNEPRQWPRCYGKVQRVFTLNETSSQPRQGYDNIHGMSGRTQ